MQTVIRGSAGTQQKDSSSTWIELGTSTTNLLKHKDGGVHKGFVVQQVSSAMSLCDGFWMEVISGRVLGIKWSVG